MHGIKLKVIFVALWSSLLIAYFHSPTDVNYFKNSDPEGEGKTDLWDQTFLVKTAGCRIIALDPYNDDVKKYIKAGESVRCKPRFSNFENGTLTIDKHVTNTWTIKNLTCCYRTIERVTQSPDKYDAKADKTITLSDSCVNVKEGKGVIVNSSFIKVECNGNGKMNASYDFHGQPLPPTLLSGETKEKANFWNNRTSKGLSNPPNIIIIGIDSVSRLHLIRSLPQTREFLLKTDFIEMLGYTRVGDNTFPNVMAGIGGMENDNYPCWPNKTTKLDDCPFIWKNFSSLNYMTAMLEDAPNIAIFNYAKRGFVNPPADYYLRPYMLALRDSPSSCASGVPPTEVVTNFVKQFLKIMGRKFPYFLYTWLSSVSHDNFNNLKTIDDALLDVMVHALENSTGNPDNTLIIFMSDHGYRVGKFRETFMGFYETNLPAFYIRLPPPLKHSNPEWYQHLKENSRKLTTPLDLHATLTQILELAQEQLTGESTTLPSKNLPPELKNRYSLFEQHPDERTCESSAIPLEYCMCGVTKHVYGTSNTSAELGRIVTARVNNLLQESIQSGICVNLTYSSVLYDRDMGSGSVWNNLGKFVNYRDHSVGVQVSPSSAKLEAKLRVFENSTALVIGEVARLNLYGNQSHCMTDYKLKLYCLCTELYPPEGTS